MTLSRDQARRLALANGITRSVLGAVAVAVPGVALRPWIGDAAEVPTSKLLARSLGARDLALGLGTVLALRHDGPVRGWVEAAGLADAGDVVSTLSAFGRLPRLGRWAVVIAAAAGVAAARLSSVSVDAG